MADDIEKVLLAVRPGASPQSGCVRRVTELARNGRVEIDVLDAVYEPNLQGYLGHDEVYEPLRRRLVGERNGALQSLIQHLRSLGLQCSGQALWGRLEEAVPSRAADTGADLAVIEPDGREGEPSHADWQLIARCPVPLLVVRGDAADSWKTIAAAVDPYQTHHKPQRLDAEILRCAQFMRQLTSARLSVVHCFAPVALFAPHPTMEGAALDDAEHAIEAARRAALTALVEQAGLPAESAILARGKPATVLRDMAAGGAADLLVLGTVSRGRLHDLVIGSTAQRVLKPGPGDVLLTPAPR